MFGWFCVFCLFKEALIFYRQLRNIVKTFIIRSWNIIRHEEVSSWTFEYCVANYYRFLDNTPAFISVNLEGYGYSVDTYVWLVWIFRVERNWPVSRQSHYADMKSFYIFFLRYMKKMMYNSAMPDEEHIELLIVSRTNCLLLL